MYKLFVVALALFAVAQAMPQYGSHGGYGGEHYESPAYYQFKYSVHDPHTGDIKSQEETAEGKSVKGVYSLKEPYGGERTVHYSDEGHGFVAHVETSKIAHPSGGYKTEGYAKSY